MTIRTAPYAAELRNWPSSGQHIMAQYDAETIVVYQAYRPSIACYAVKHQRFGGDFSFARMSWIKPNFLWMMFRSGVRLQWDPDHDPFGNKLPRRAIQLGLRGEILEKYATDWIASIEDITPFVKQQRDNLRQRGVEQLIVPAERPYIPDDAGTVANVGLAREVFK